MITLMHPATSAMKLSRIKQPPCITRTGSRFGFFSPLLFSFKFNSPNPGDNSSFSGSHLYQDISQGREIFLTQKISSSQEISNHKISQDQDISQGREIFLTQELSSNQEISSIQDISPVQGISPNQNLDATLLRLAGPGFTTGSAPRGTPVGSPTGTPAGTPATSTSSRPSSSAPSPLSRPGKPGPELGRSGTRLILRLSASRTQLSWRVLFLWCFS